MQTITMNLIPCRIFHDINRLYSDVSSYHEPCKLLPSKYNESFRDVCNLLYNNVGWFDLPVFESVDIPKLQYKRNTKDIVVCISGGKDSVATAIYYKNLGYNVYLYHLHGINKAYYDEFEAVKKIAKYLNLPYYIDKCTVNGTHDFIEHPLKNYIIADGAISWAIKNNIAPNIAFGNFNKSRLEDMQFDVCGGDSMDMWYAYDKIISRIIPGFKMNVPLSTQADTYRLLGDDKEIIVYCMSCISPYRFREHWKERTETKYNIELLPHRCGCCWKDCVEWITLADKDLVQFNEDYYIHCLEILGHTMLKEADAYEVDVQEIWEQYISYDISKSRMGDKIKHAVIRNGKIKYN